MRTILRTVARVVGAVFFALAAVVYINFHFFTEDGSECNAFGLFPLFQAACHYTALVWLLVALIATPGIVLWTWATSKSGENADS